MRLPKYRKHSSKDIGFVEWMGKWYYFSGRYGSVESNEAYRQFVAANVILAKPAEVQPTPSRAVELSIVASARSSEASSAKPIEILWPQECLADRPSNPH